MLLYPATQWLWLLVWLWSLLLLLLGAGAGAGGGGGGGGGSGDVATVAMVHLLYVGVQCGVHICQLARLSYPGHRKSAI